VICVTELYANPSHDTINPMRLAAKFVAVVLGMVLGAAPLFAAIPCTTGTRAMAHGAKCCGAMAKSAMMMTSSVDAVQPAGSQDLSVPPCCAISSSKTTTPAIAREAQRPVTQAVAQADSSVHLAAVVPSARQHARPLPAPSANSRPQSTLCTFLI